MPNEMPDTTPLALRDIHLPPDISIWPLAPGWWMLLGLLLVIGVVSFVLYQRHQGLRVRKAAMMELNRIQCSYDQQGDDQALLVALSIWLRRVVVSHYSVDEVAGLTGSEWLRFLDSALGKTPSMGGFSQGVGRVLVAAPYQRPGKNEAHVDSAELLVLCRTWLYSLPSEPSVIRGKR